jgi:hypothetical protein
METRQHNITLPGPARRRTRERAHGLYTEQFSLCAYCCQTIAGDNSHNEHVEAQDKAPNRTWSSPTSSPVASARINVDIIEARAH